MTFILKVYNLRMKINSYGKSIIGLKLYGVSIQQTVWLDLLLG